MVDVFISYSRENKARVADIAAEVTAAGYEVWWDAELPPHRSYGDVIAEKIGHAKAAIVVWSHASAQSEWVRAEADVARNQKKLVQTAIDDVMPPLPFNQIQFADLSDWRGESDHRGWSKVLMSLGELCGREPVPEVAQRPVSRPAASEPSPIERHAPLPAQRSSFLPWALLSLAVIAVALLAWKLFQPSSVPATASAPTATLAPTVEAPGKSGASTVAPAEAFTLAAVIDDPDGFTNIRSGQSTKAAIVGKVLEGEKFLTYQQPGQWWRVRKADGTAGFMFRKYIRVVESGAVAAPKIPVPASGDGIIISDSATRTLGPADVAGLSPQQARLARNEIFARHGFRFKDPSLQSYFGQFPWYQPTSDSVELSAVEKANVALLKSAETGGQ
ncbi:YARHG domain-containing protein [Sphingopyxis sp.]|uniref:YARHG domain-containing protein n=1 Tax=Sphingopyxis sp. TaxID=1908224 RepID=UPI0035ADB100